MSPSYQYKEYGKGKTKQIISDEIQRRFTDSSTAKYIRCTQQYNGQYKLSSLQFKCHIWLQCSNRIVTVKLWLKFYAMNEKGDDNEQWSIS